MPRRMITPNIWRNDKFGYLSITAKLLFIGMFSIADDDGRLKALPKYLKANIFPYDDITIDDISKYRKECEQNNLVHCYRNGNCDYIYLSGWYEHQHIRKDLYKPSKLPTPPTGVVETLHLRNADGTKVLPKNTNDVTKSHPSIVKDSIVKDSNRGEKGGLGGILSSTNKNKNLSGDIYKLFERENICKLTQITSQEIGEIIDKYGKFENGRYIKMAVKEAVIYNKRSIKYVLGILESWYTEGRKHDEGRDAPLYTLEPIDDD